MKEFKNSKIQEADIWSFWKSGADKNECRLLTGYSTYYIGICYSKFDKERESKLEKEIIPNNYLELVWLQNHKPIEFSFHSTDIKAINLYKQLTL